MYKANELRGEVRIPVQAEGWDLSTLMMVIKSTANERGIPVNVTQDEFKTGGLRGKVLPCIIINHPDPPMSYFKQMIIKNGDVFSFNFCGYSVATHKTNLNENDSKKGTLTGMIKKAVRGDLSYDLQLEQAWHRNLNEVYKKIWGLIE